MRTKLPHLFYQSNDVVSKSRDLIGKVLYTSIDGNITAGIITESEAYRGREDRACHGKICTPRTQIMYGPWWHAYVYLCYGIHILFNIVTNQAWNADGILIRSIHPIQWINNIQQRIGSIWSEKYLINGPGKVSKAMGIQLSDYGSDLTWDHIWLEDIGLRYTDEQLQIWPRVGIDYAWDDALLPWRFQLLNLDTTSTKLLES